MAHIIKKRKQETIKKKLVCKPITTAIGQLLVGSLNLRPVFKTYKFSDEMRPKIIRQLLTRNSCLQFANVIDSFGEDIVNTSDYLQISWTPEQLKDFDEKSYKLASTVFPKFASVVLCRITYNHGHFVDWHQIADNSCLSAMQIFLNSPIEYEGGETAFVMTNGYVSIPKREAGDAIIYGDKIMVGVTEMKSGNNYSMFLLK